MKKLTFIFIGLLLLSVLDSSAQVVKGINGRVFFLQADAALSPAFLAVARQEGTPWVNVTYGLSANVVLNRREVLGIQFRRWQNKASFEETALDFYTNEIGASFQWVLDDLDAPMGGYMSLGMGIGLSKYREPIYALDNGPVNPSVLAYDNTRPIISPIVRYGIGYRSLFWKRFMFDAGFEFGFNMGALPYMLGTIETNDDPSLKLDKDAKEAVQRRLVGLQLINFRMGLAFMIF